MGRKLIILFLLMLTVNGFAQDQITGDVNLAGRLEFIYPDTKHMVSVDGSNLEATQDMKTTIELTHGKHLFQIYAIKGMFKRELASEEHIHIPGGYIVRATLKDSKVMIIDTVPIPGLITTIPEPTPQEKAEAALVESQTTTTTTTMTTSTGTSSQMMGMKVGIGDEKASISIQMPGMGEAMTTGVTITEQTTITSTETTSMAQPTQAAPPPPPTIRYSKIVVMSEEGNCEVFLDGQRKMELGFGDIDELAKGTIFDVKPGTYLLKIEGFDVWYDGKLKVGSGEEIKIRTEPGKMQVIGRNTMP